LNILKTLNFKWQLLEMDYKELGGGEVNNTFLLTCSELKIVLRIARYNDQHTLQYEAQALGF
jgi:hypothetical protein